MFSEQIISLQTLRTAQSLTESHMLSPTFMALTQRLTGMSIFEPSKQLTQGTLPPFRAA